MADRRHPRPRQFGVSRNLSGARRQQTADEWMAQIQSDIGARMAEIAAMFLPGAKVTVLVRRPTDDRADVCITDDEFPDLIAMLRRCQARDAGGGDA